MEQQTPMKLEVEVTALLSDYAHPEQPPSYACHHPKKYEYKTSHWTLSQLVDVAIKEGIADFIFAKTISYFLIWEKSTHIPSDTSCIPLKSGRLGNICRKSQ